MKKHNIKEFDVQFLDKLTEDEASCIYLRNTQHHLALHPYHLRDLNNSVSDILSKGIGKFCKWLDGILCGYKNVKFLSELGVICDDSCFVHVDIEADFFIFNPKVDNVLKGVVNKKSKDHVGCLVHKIFNVSLPKPKHGSDWIGYALELGNEVYFQVTLTNFDGKLPYIKGEIISVDGQSPTQNRKIKFADPDDPDDLPPVKKKKSKKKSESNDSLEDGSLVKKEIIKTELVVSEEEQKPIVKPEKVKKKKHKTKKEKD